MAALTISGSCLAQTQIVALNAHNFLKNGGHFVISIKASCIDSTAEPAAVFASEVCRHAVSFTAATATHSCDISHAPTELRRR